MFLLCVRLLTSILNGILMTVLLVEVRAVAGSKMGWHQISYRVFNHVSLAFVISSKI